MMKRDLLKISILKTFRFNFSYFCPLSQKDGSWKQFIRFPVVISKNVILKKLDGKVVVCDEKRVTLGFGNIDDFDEKCEKSIFNNDGVIEFRGKCHIGHGTRINNHGRLVFGNNFVVSANSTIDCEHEIRFGENVLLSWDVLIMDHDTHSIMDLYGNRVNNDEPIIIGDNVWVCCRSTILKSTNVPNDCVIAAGTILCSGVKESNTIIGNQGKIIKQNIIWKY